MNTTVDKLKYLNNTKDAIKVAIIHKGVPVTPQDTFRSYADKISQISIDRDSQAYGVEWDITVDNPRIKRIGNPLLHKSLPIQSQYKGCVVKNGVLQYWLSPINWSLKEDGTPSILDGTDGDVCVCIPKFYGKSEEDGNIRRVWISLIQIDGTWQEIPEMYVDAYRFTVSGGIAYSVINTTPEFRGGGNRVANDTFLETEPTKSDLGKPRTALPRSTMRKYAEAAGKELLCYEFYKWIFYWNYVIEYANFNSQDTYNSELTPDGYHQGGLGPGVTTLSNWKDYNGYYPLTPCGYCNEFGNGTGVKNLIIPEFTYDDKGTQKTQIQQTLRVTRWRGFDNPFGDIWTNLDGVVIKRNAAGELVKVYTTSDPTKFDDTITNKRIAGEEINQNGYIKEFALGEYGEIIPSAVGASSTTGKCDYHYQDPNYLKELTLLVGGGAYDGGGAGLGYFHSDSSVGNSYATVGFRALKRIK